MFPEMYIESMKLDNANVVVHASIDASGKPYWSITGECYGMAMKLNGYDDNDSLEKLKELKKLINGAISHINDNTNKNDVAEQKNHVNNKK